MEEKEFFLEEAVVKPLCEELTTMPILHPPVPPRREEVGNQELSEVQEKKRWVGGRYF